MRRNKIKNTAEFLIESGLLFEINRKILHPFGLALEVIVDEDEKIVIGPIWDQRDDPEGIVFSDDSFNSGKEKFEKFLNEFGTERLNTRMNLLGYTVQEDLCGDSIHDTDPNLEEPDPEDDDIKTDIFILPEEEEET